MSVGPITYTSDDAGGLPASPARASVRVRESASLYDLIPWQLQRFLDGPTLLGPLASGYGAYGYGATGTVTDRRHGRDLQQFWTEQDLRNFRLLSRHLAEKNPVGKGFMGLLTDFHIRGGFGWQACRVGSRKGAYDTGTAEADPSVRRAQWVLDRWRDGQRGRVQSKWPLRAREAFLRWRRDGEVFVRLFDAGPGNLPVMRFIDSAQIGSPTGTSDGPDSFGVLCDQDDAETVLAYFVRAAAGTGVEGEWVSARRDPQTIRRAEQLLGRTVKPGTILHLPANVDAGVKRGVPDFLPVAEQVDGVDRLVDNMLTAAIAQAAIAWVEQYATATEDQVRSLIEQGRDYQRPKYPLGLTSGKTSNVSRTEGGTVRHVDGGRNILPGPSSQPGGLIEVEQAALRWVGVLWRFPEYFSGDASNGTYASLKESGSPFVAAVEGTQYVWGAFEQAVALAALELAADAGVDTPDGPFTRADLDRVDVETTAPKVVLNDPQRDAQVNDTKLRNGTMSKAEAILADGRDPKHTFANIAAEAKQDQATPGTQPGEEGFRRGRWRRGGDDQPAADPFGGLTEAVLRESKFTGTLVDAAGHKRTYVDGVQVKGPGDTTAPVSPARASSEPAAAPASWKAHPVTAKLASSLKASPGLTPEQRADYGKAAATVLGRMTPKALERLHANLSAAHFHPDNRAVGEAVAADLEKTHAAFAAKLRGQVAEGLEVGGAYVHTTGAVHADGGLAAGGLTTSASLPENTPAHVYAHEWAHAVDGPRHELSGSPAWQAAFQAEFGDGRLTRYASTSPTEAFAEFARCVWAAGLPPEKVEKAFPKAAAAWREAGLWPA